PSPNVTRTSPSLSQPRICVESHAYAWEANSSRLKFTLEELNVTPSTPNPFQKPRICVEQHAYAWKASSMPKISKIHIYA
ncbi:hypothetical protein PIB30_114646, partial [Stylosanthes scabra]|nr:hypothetical protein [Stylosanthes scabra]